MLRIVKGSRYEFHPLPALVKLLNHTHRTIDILKIDIEGEEYEIIKDSLFHNLQAIGVVIRQILIEMHHSVDVYSLVSL
jgi:Methyltransferase domain